MKLAPMKLSPMKLTVALLCLAAPACAAPAPRLVPDRDVSVSYTVHPRDHATVDARVEIEAGGRHLRIASEQLPTAFLVDRPAQTATVLLPMLKLYATVGIGRYDPEETVLRGASFTRHGRRRVAGLACTVWSAVSPQGHAEACITDDGVILAGTAWDAHGEIGSVQASAVQYGALPPVVFRRPDDYRSAGSLPIESLAGMQ